MRSDGLLLQTGKMDFPGMPSKDLRMASTLKICQLMIDLWSFVLISIAIVGRCISKAMPPASQIKTSKRLECWKRYYPTIISWPPPVPSSISHIQVYIVSHSSKSKCLSAARDRIEQASGRQSGVISRPKNMFIIIIIDIKDQVRCVITRSL